MDKSNLGDRMKQYENAFNSTYPIRLPLILRLDGVHFHSNVTKWKCEKPFDNKLIEAMSFTALKLCESIAGAKIAYVQSDEITILIRDDMTNNSQPWYGKEINKIISVSAAKASNAFNWKYHSLNEEENYGTHSWDLKLNEMAEFDCRGWVVPENEIINVFNWRQQDFSRNSVQMLGRANFSHSQLNNKNNNEIQDMLMLEKEINWNNLPIHLKRGSCIIKKYLPKKVPKRDGKGKILKEKWEIIIRPQWLVDKEIPIFTQSTEYINKYAKLAILT